MWINYDNNMASTLQAGAFFNPEELKQQLYDLKSRGPNPLMNVLLAAGRDMEVTTMISQYLV